MKSECPVCGEKEATCLEDINLESQHKLYSESSKDVQVALTKSARTAAEKYTMLKCVNCQLEYAEPLIGPPASWYSLAYRILSLYPSDRWEFSYVMSHLNSASVIGEFGCGSGFFLRKCISKGIQCEGFDFSQDVVDKGKANGLPMSVLNLSKSGSEQISEDKKFDVFTSFHVLEHLDNPSMLFKSAWDLSKENADLWISVPSDRRVSRISAERDFLDQPPHHLTRWNSSSLSEIGSKNGWDLKEIIYEPIALKDALWSYTTRFAFYKNVESKLKKQEKWVERLFRYSLYPLAFLKWISVKPKMTGFTVLARYSK